MRNLVAMAGEPIWRRKDFFDPKRVQHLIIPEPLNKDRVCLGHRCGRQGLDQSSWCKDRLYLAGIALGEWLQRTV